MNLFEKPKNIKTRWVSFESPTIAPASAGLENHGAKGHAFDSVKAGETKTLLDCKGSGTITRMWFTIVDRSPEMLRSLRIDMFWDDSETPAVSVPFGDFFGLGLGHMTTFENALFSSPEGRSFNCFIPMPFRTAARITVTNEAEKDLTHLFYDVDLLVDVDHSPEALYFHASWRKENPNTLGQDFQILPKVTGNGRFLGSNIGVIASDAYKGAWWGEGEVKVRFGNEETPTLCGTGTEDYIGTGWGQGAYCNRTQGCLIAESQSGHYCFYRYHLDDPVYFDEGCQVSIQTIGGTDLSKTLELIEEGVSLTPVTADFQGSIVKLNEHPMNVKDIQPVEGWCNFWRQDDWSATAYYYLDSPQGQSPTLAEAAQRLL